jgi:tRNA A-37 threonylcarbamoyl transferase component Bud32
MEFIGGIARKTGSPALLAVEALKTRKAAEIGKNTGLFYVPKVVNFDSEAGVLEFEWLKDTVTLLKLAVGRNELLSGLLEQAGQALAVVHEQLILPNSMRHELPPEWMGSSDDNVFIHGDFTLCNVCFHEQSEQLVILDWSAAPLLGRTPVFGSKYFDILWFVGHAFSAAPNRGLFSWNPERIADAFIKGYAMAIQPKKLDKLNFYWSRFLRLYKRNVWYQVRHRELYRACVYISSQSFLYYKLWAKIFMRIF